MSWNNHFLDALQPDVVDLLRPSIKLLKLRRNQPLAQQDEPLTHVTLPITAIISVVVVMGDGRQVESRTIGRESAFGLLHVLGSRLTFERVTCQLPGEAYQIPIAALAKAAAEQPSLVAAIVGHAQAAITQATQATACNALHSAEGRLCRWLAMTQDRLGADVVPLTQEHLAIMVGVQRTTITALALDLQGRGLIDYKRGKITVLDRPALLRNSCECYDAIQDMAGKILKTYQTHPVRAG
jgi:CRP-like cAMP-binding protein